MTAFSVSSGRSLKRLATQSRLFRDRYLTSKLKYNLGFFSKTVLFTDESIFKVEDFKNCVTDSSFRLSRALKSPMRLS